MRFLAVLLLSVPLIGCMSSEQVLKLPDSFDETVEAVRAEGPATTLTVHIRQPTEGEDADQVREAASRVTLERLLRFSSPYPALGGSSSIGQVVESADARWEDVLVIDYRSVNRGKGAARGAIIGAVVIGALGFALGASIDAQGWDDFAEGYGLAGAALGGAIGALGGLSTGYRRTVIWRR